MESTVQCGRCGVTIAAAQADVSADGYRCLSCSTDETLAERAADRYRDADRMNGLRGLRALFALPFLLILAWDTSGLTRWIALAAVAGLATFTWFTLRRLLRT